jgi:hypothetical protein
MRDVSGTRDAYRAVSCWSVYVCNARKIVDKRRSTGILESSGLRQATEVCASGCVGDGWPWSRPHNAEVELASALPVNIHCTTDVAERCIALHEVRN